jgi:hypothetical protein
MNNPWKTEFYDQIDAVVAGAAASPWVAVPFNAANFSTPTAGATWVVTSAHYHYMRMGQGVLLSLAIVGSGTITGAPVRLYVQYPAGLTPQRVGGTTYSYYAGSGPGVGLAQITPGVPLDLLKDVTGATFAAGAMSLYLQAFYAIA